MVKNATLMEVAINHVGSRVSVDVFNLHLSALYDYMDVPISSSMASNDFKTNGDKIMVGSYEFEFTYSLGCASSIKILLSVHYIPL